MTNFQTFGEAVRHIASPMCGILGVVETWRAYRNQDHAKANNGLLFAIALLLLAILLK